MRDINVTVYVLVAWAVIFSAAIVFGLILPLYSDILGVFQGLAGLL